MKFMRCKICDFVGWFYFGTSTTSVSCPCCNTVHVGVQP